MSEYGSVMKSPACKRKLYFARHERKVVDERSSLSSDSLRASALCRDSPTRTAMRGSVGVLLIIVSETQLTELAA